MKDEELYLKVIRKFKEFIERDKEFKIILDDDKYAVIFHDFVGAYSYIEYMEDPQHLFETLLHEWRNSFEENLNVDIAELDEEQRKEFETAENEYLEFFREVFGEEFVERSSRLYACGW